MREFDSRLHIALEFLKHGYAALLGRKAGVHAQMFTDGRRPFYFAKGMRLRNAGHYQRIHAHGGALISMDEENYIRLEPSQSEILFAARNEEAALAHADLILVWSELQAAGVRAQAPSLPADRVAVVGNARFDLRKERYNSVFERLPKSRSFRPGYVLINTSFGAGNSLLGREKSLEKARIRMGGAHREDFFEIGFAYQRLLVKYFIDAIMRAAKVYPDRDFIFRPHPIERIDTYTEAFDGIPNIHVIHEGFVHQWIVDARAIIHHGCTTGLEALFNRKPSISYCPILDLSIANDAMILMSEIIRSEDDLVTRLGVLFNEEPAAAVSLSPEQRETIHKIVANLDFNGTAAIVEAVRVRAATWVAVAPAVAPSPPSGRFRRMLSAGRRALSGGAGVAPQEEAYAAYRHGKLDAITQEEVETLIQLLREVDEEIPPCVCRSVGRDTFMLERASTS